MPLFEVSTPDGRRYEVNAPDGATQDDAISYVKENLWKPKEEKLKAEDTMGTAFQRGLETMGSQMRTGVSGLLNPTEAAIAGQQRGEDIQSRLGPEESRLEKVKRAYEEKGLLPAIGTGLNEIPKAISEQAPQLATAFGSARLGAMAGTPLGPYGAGGGALVGMFLPSFFQQYGGNIERQADVQKETGQPIDIKGGRAALAATPQAVFDVAENLIPFGGKIASGIFGPSIGKLLSRGMTKEAEELAVKKLSQETFLPSLKNLDLGTVVKGTGKTVALEMPTEIAQQMLERKQAGLDLFSKDALKEYGETAFDIALLGPLGIYGRVSDKSAARKQLLDAQKEAAEIGKPVEVPLQLGFDPNVSNTKTIIMHPDGSTSFPSEANNFYENPVSELSKQGLKEAYAPQQGTIVPPAPVKAAPVETPPVIYGNTTGEVGQSPEEVQQAEYFKQQALTRQAQIQRTITPATIKSFGIGNTANIYKDKDVIGADIGDPIQATIVKNKLLSVRDKHTNPLVKQKINEFLSKPEFSPEKIGEAAQPIETPTITKAQAPVITSAKTATVSNGVWQDVQNRDRTTPASINQMNLIASNPSYDRASFSNSFSEGAPVVSGSMTIPENQLGRKGNIVTGDNQKIPVQYAVIDASQVMPSHNVNGSKNPDYVSSDYKGLRAITNGRVAGLQAGYARGTMDDYVTDLTHDDMHGISKDVIKGIKNPMLVRVMPQESINKHTGDVSNTGSGLSLNVVEQAKNDINRINLEGIQFNEDGEITEKSVRDFIRAMPQTEQNNLITKDGAPSKQAYDRLNAAIFQQAYQNDKLTELAFQSPDEEIKNIVRALNMAAPVAIHLDGLGDYDVRPYVNEAVEMAINAKRNSISLSNLVKQSDMTTHPLSKDILEMFANNPRSAKAMGENLNTLFNDSFKESTQSADMFGEVQKKPIHQVIKDSFTKKPEEDLFTPKAELKELSTEGLTVPKGRHPQVVAAARERQAGRMSREEYEKYVDKYMPISEVSEPRPPASLDKMKEVLKSNQIEKLNPDISSGTRVGLRMDINALQKGGSVVSIHEGGTAKTLGKTMGYSSTARVKNVNFTIRKEADSIKVAAGEEYKMPQQTVEGEWVKSTPEKDFKDIQSLLKNPEWSQVSLDPLRHSYFYDRKSTNPVVSADEVIQVGNFLLAKNVKFADKENFLYDVTPTDKFKGDIKELQTRLKKSLDKLGLQSVSLKVNKNLQAMIDGKPTNISGKYFNKLIYVALHSSDPLRTLHHEAIHALKDLGMFSDAEWAVLERAAEDKWIKQYGIEERYGKFSREVQIEEAIANAFPDFMKMGAKEKSLYQRVKDFFSRVRNVFRGMGYMTSEMAFNSTPEAVFQKVKENILTGNKEISSGGMRLDTSNGTASFLPERLNKILNEYTYTMDEKATKAYITYMSPLDFLKATTTSLEHENEIRKQAGNLDREKLKQYDMYPFLQVEEKNGKYAINGHEGRHRMAALDKAGIKSVPVVVIPRGGRINNSKPISKYTSFLPQYFPNSGDYAQSGFLLKDEMLPLSYEYANQVKEKFTTKNADVRFERATDNFKRWFGNSKVVDDNGKPLVVYHGTDKSDFNIFNPASWFTDNTTEASAYTQTDLFRKRERLLNKYTLSNDVSPIGKTIPFASVLSDIDDLKVGNYYAEGGEDGPVYKYLGKNKFEVLKNVVVDLDSQDLRTMTTKLKKGFSQEAVDQVEETKKYANTFEGGEGGRVYPVYLSIKNPLYLDAMQVNTLSERLGKSKEDIQKQIDKWKSQGYDGIFTESDEARFFPDVRSAMGGIPKQYIPFDSNQIKSATGNNGEYSLENNDIRYELSLDDVNPATAKKIQSIFGPTKKSTIKEKFEELKPNFYNRVITGLFDEFRPIKNYGDEAYMKAVLSKTTDGALEGLLMHGHVTLKDGALDIKQGTKGLLDILKPLGADVERYQVWKALNRDANLPENKRSFKDLIPQRNELLNGNINGVPRKDIYQKVLNEENKLNKSVLDVAKAQGTIDDEAYERFSNDIYYIPFYKAMENGDIVSVQDSSKLTGQYFSKALKGGEKEKMGDLMENTLRNWSHILSASMKNAAAISTLDSAVKLEAAEEVKSTYEGKNVLTVMKNGKKAYYAVTDPNLVESISMISFLGPKSPFLDVAKGFTNALRVGVTLAPGYKLRNLIRDTVSSAAISPVGMNVLDNVQRGLKLSNKGNPTYVSAMAGGGVFELGAAHEGNQAALVKRLIAKGVKSDTVLSDVGQIKNVLKDMYEKYNEFGNKFENANRLALYDKMIKEGKSHLEASYAARDLLNFTGQGSWRAVKTISQVVPFFNTRLQGLYKLGRDGISPTSRVLCNMATGKPIEESDKLKAQRFSIVSTAVALASIGLYMAYKDDDDFKKREDWDRDNFWWFKVGDTAFRIPKPFEIGALATIAERSVEQLEDENVEGKVFVQRLHSVIMDNLSMNPTPQFIKPMIDLYANKDSFTGAPIETSGMERLSKQERYTNNTSELAKALGGVTEGAAKILTLNPDAQGFSPIQMDYALKGYLGWLGSTVASVSDKAVQPWSDVEKPSKPSLDQYAMGFAKSLPETQSKFVTEFYDNSKRINEAFADMKRFAEHGEMEKVANIMAEKGNLIALQNVYNQTTTQMAEYRKYINIITTDKKMSKEDKENEITRMKLLISQLAENAETMRTSLNKK